MIQNIRETRLKPQLKMLQDHKALGKTSGNGDRSRPFENPHSGIADSSGSIRRRNERVYIEPLVWARVGNIPIADPVRAELGSAPQNVGPGLILRWTC